MKTSAKTSVLAPLTIAMSLLIRAMAVGAELVDSPLSTQQERSAFHFADENLTAELVAAEPDVVAPVAMAWDADGRLLRRAARRLLRSSGHEHRLPANWRRPRRLSHMQRRRRRK